MKKFLFVSVITLLLAVSFNSYAADETYFGVNLGIATVEENGIDTGFLGSVTYGTGLGEYRVEGELLYQVNDTDIGADFKTLAFLINGYYDFDTQSDIKPYITAGLGYGSSELGPFDDEDFVWAVGAGISYNLNETTVLDIRYRYYGLEVGDGTDGHSGIVGLRFNF